jgi:hypothetical protein
MIMELFYPAITTTVLMYVWFETEAFEEYLCTFNLWWFDMDKYKNERKKISSLDYHTYLLMNYPDSFFIKLFTCPVCLIVWVAPLVYLAYFGTKDISVATVFREILLGWIMFFSLKLLVNKTDS